MDVANVLDKNRIIFLTGDITQELINGVIAKLLCLEQEDKDEEITIYLNSPGGDSNAMHALLDVFELITPDISIVNVSCAYSAASLILAAGTKGKRFSLPSAKAMIHQVSLHSARDRWTCEEVNELSRSITQTQNDYIKRMLKHTKITKEQMNEFMKKDTYLSARQCLDYGIIDKIL